MKTIAPFAVMCVGMFMALLDIQIVASSFQDIGGGLSAAQDETSWLQTAYLIAEIIMIPLSGWLTRVFSTRWLFAGSAIGFTLASLFCGLAWNIETMIFFRALQGLLGASMIPVVLTSAFYYFPGPRQVISAAILGTLSFLAPTLGPVIGGLITDLLNWHWLFYINLVPGTIIAILSLLWVRIDRPDFALLHEADYCGIILMAIGLGTLEYVLEEGNRWNWFSDTDILYSSWVSGLALSGFVVRSLSVENPVVDFRAFGNRNFTIGCLLSFITGIGIFSTTYLTPLFLGYVVKFSAWQIGIALFPSGIASLAAMPVYIVLARRYDLRWIMMMGLFAFGLAMLSFSFITSAWTAENLFLPQILRGLPLVFCVAPSITLGLGSLTQERLKYASGLFNMMRNLGGAVGIALCGTVLSDQTNIHFNALAYNLTASHGPVIRLISAIGHHFSRLMSSQITDQRAALSVLWQLTYTQAETLAYSDAFLLLAVIFLSASCLVPLMRKTM